MLTPEQRAELERRGWEYSILPDGYESVKKGDFVYWSSIGVVDGDISQVPELLAVLGIAPPGYRLVPDSVVREAAWLLCKMAEGDAPTHWDRTRAPEVAAALRGESTDLSPASGR